MIATKFMNPLRCSAAWVLGLWMVGASAATTLVPSPPQVKAQAYLVEDYASGKVLVEHNVDERLEPASLTKMMTVYVVLSEIAGGQFSMDDLVRISSKARSMQGSRMFLEIDSMVSVHDLLMGVVVQSGNDASVALAEFVAGDESSFSNLMNQYSAKLGMTGSHFTNASGLPDPDHYTTTRDMALLAKALIRDFPDEYTWHAVRKFTHNGIEQPNRNRLLGRDKRVDGLKTGYTANAGYCMVISGIEGDMRLIVVVMNTSSPKARAQYSQSLLNYGFRFYETHRVYKAREPVTSVRVWKGEASAVGLGLPDDLFVTVPRGRYKDLDARLELDPQVMAPVRAGARKGKVTIKLADEVLADLPLLALQPVAEGNLWDQLRDHVKLMFE